VLLVHSEDLNFTNFSRHVHEVLFLEPGAVIHVSLKFLHIEDCFGKNVVPLRTKIQRDYNQS